MYPVSYSRSASQMNSQCLQLICPFWSIRGSSSGGRRKQPSSSKLNNKYKNQPRAAFPLSVALVGCCSKRVKRKPENEGANGWDKQTQCWTKTEQTIWQKRNSIYLFDEIPKQGGKRNKHETMAQLKQHLRRQMQTKAPKPYNKALGSPNSKL